MKKGLGSTYSLLKSEQRLINSLVNDFVNPEITSGFFFACLVAAYVV